MQSWSVLDPLLDVWTDRLDIITQPERQIISPIYHVQSWSVLGQLLDVWTDRLDIITQPERRKICGLAFASLLTLNNRSVAADLPLFVISVSSHCC